MNTHAHPDAWRLQVLKLLKINPTLSQRQLAEQLGVSLGKAKLLPARLGRKRAGQARNFSKNPNKGKYAYLLTPAGLEEKAPITFAFLKRKEAEFEAIQREIEILRGSKTQTLLVKQVHKTPNSRHPTRLKPLQPQLNNSYSESLWLTLTSKTSTTPPSRNTAGNPLGRSGVDEKGFDPQGKYVVALGPCHFRSTKVETLLGDSSDVWLQDHGLSQ